MLSYTLHPFSYTLLIFCIAHTLKCLNNLTAVTSHVTPMAYTSCLLVMIVLLCLVALCNGFYLPGLAPVTYCKPGMETETCKVFVSVQFIIPVKRRDIRSVEFFGLSVCHHWRGSLRYVCGHTNHAQLSHFWKAELI